MTPPTQPGRHDRAGGTMSAEQMSAHHSGQYNMTADTYDANGIRHGDLTWDSDSRTWSQIVSGGDGDGSRGTRVPAATPHWVQTRRGNALLTPPSAGGASYTIDPVSGRIQSTVVGGATLRQLSMAMTRVLHHPARQIVIAWGCVQRKGKPGGRSTIADMAKDTGSLATVVANGVVVRDWNIVWHEDEDSRKGIPSEEAMLLWIEVNGFLWRFL